MKPDDVGHAGLPAKLRDVALFSAPAILSLVPFAPEYRERVWAVALPSSPRASSRRASANGLGRVGLALGGGGPPRLAVEDRGDLAGDFVGRHSERLVDMDIALRHAAGRVAEQRCDRQFGEAQIAGDAGKRMPQGVRRHVGETSERADPIERTHDADEVACAPIGGEEAGEGIRTPDPNLGQAVMLIGALSR
jgi:hypothetical protein